MSERPKTENPYGLDISEEARMFRAVVQMGEVGILILDEQNRIEFANRIISQITGYEVDGLLGKNFMDFLDGKNREAFQSLKEECNTYTTKLCQKIEIISASSAPAVTQMCCAHYSTAQSGEGKYFVYLRDISVQQKLTEELRESERKYRNLFDRIDQGISENYILLNFTPRKWQRIL